METFVCENLILTVLLILFGLEQIAYLWIGSYPYRFGIRVRTENLTNSDILRFLSRPLVLNGLRLKVSAKYQEAYLKPKYLIGWGPIFFTAQITTSQTGGVNIRMGPLSTVLIIYLLIAGVISDGTWSMLNGLFLLCLIGYLYISFVTKYNAFAEQIRTAGSTN
jgi:hypothetical protein